jgi:gamma-butyrobetaine dioxygenase
MSARWSWDPLTGPARLGEELRRDGIAVIAMGAAAADIQQGPWSFAERLLGQRPWLVERQPIKPIPGGRSFSSGSMTAPFHTDSQCALGVPPSLQVMLCVQPAREGGESLYLDTWPLLARIAREDPALLGLLFERQRRLPFVFGDFIGATVSLRGSHLVFSHTAFPRPGDRVAVQLQPWIDAAPVIAVKACAGDAIVIHNHRLLHGRRAFDDPARAFVRLLVWNREPWPAPEELLARAGVARQRLEARTADAPPALQARLGIEAPAPVAARQRLDVVLELLRGTPAGVLAGREDLSEAELYRWRDAVLRAGLGSLGEVLPRDEQALDRLLAE